MHMMLKLITLTANQIGDAGATQLANVLQHNSTLTALFLHGKHDCLNFSFFTLVFVLFHFPETAFLSDRISYFKAFCFLL